MLRSFFIYLSKATWAQRAITRLGIARRAARRFYAGDTPDEAITLVRQLNQMGILATLDHLGENTSTLSEASHAVEEILLILDKIEVGGVRSNVSIKLSQIGLLLDQDICQQNLISILERARQRRNFVRIDMEDSSLTAVTLQLFRAAKQAGYSNVGIVIQSYLYRSDDDIQSLMADGERVRLVKGAYMEPPDVAYPHKKDVDLAFDRMTELLLKGSKAAGCPALSADGRVPPIPALATHDEKRIQFGLQKAEELGIPKTALEFQMLYGIRRGLQENLAAQGYPVRVYVPYGQHWYPYYMRRLAERPANIWFIISNLLRR